MQRSLIIAASLALVFAGSAHADEFADSAVDIDRVETGTAADGTTPLSTAADDGDDGSDATGAPDFDSTFATISSLGFDEKGDNDPNNDVGGFVVLDFTDNACVDGPDDDLQVFDAADNESASVEVGTGGPLTSIGSVGPSGYTLDLNGTGVAGFNQIKLTATDWAGQTTAAGIDVDAIECLNSLEQDDIVKTNTGDPFIDVGVDTQQTGFSFTIEIINNIGDDAFENLTFLDVLPGEFDLDDDAEDLNDGVDDDDCADGDCDGIDTTNASLCDVSHDTSEGAKKKSRNKLEPEHIIIDASGLDETDSCTIEVFAKTDTKDFPSGKSPDATPTSCPEDPGTITLNEGVKVFDASMNLLLQDDDSLTLQCTSFTD